MSEEQRLCGAKTAHGPCRNWKERGADRCKYHGARAARGVAAPSYASGRYSKYVPKGLAEAYGRAITDPDLMNNEEEVALLQARVIDLLKRLETGEGATLWEELTAWRTGLEASYRNLQRAVTSGNGVEFERCYRALGACVRDLRPMLERATKREEAWDDIQKAIEQKTRTAKREHDRRVDMQTMLSSEQAMKMVVNIMESVKRHVTDPEALRLISTDLSLFTRAPNNRQRWLDVRPADVGGPYPPTPDDEEPDVPEPDPLSEAAVNAPVPEAKPEAPTP